MREYRIYNLSKGASIRINADTPQDAVKNVYKKHNIDISISNDKNTATHMVELLNSSKKSINYYKVVVCYLDRKPKPDNYIEPMPKKQFQEIVKKFKAKGGVILTDENAKRFLKNNNAEACTLNDTTILFNTERPGRSAVYEELIHAEQFRKGQIDGTEEKRLICEIEAQKILIEKKDELGITDIEDKQTRSALKAYKKEYAQLMKKRKQ